MSEYEKLAKTNINTDTAGLSSNYYERSIIEDLIKGSQKIVQREEQCKVMLIISQLYFTIFKDSKKVMDCLNKARRFADFAMTNPKNLILFVEYLNKILYFIEKEEKVIDIKPEQVEDIIELIKGHIRTIKNIPSDDVSFLENIVKNRKYYPQIVAIMCITSVIISNFGFSNLVKFSFPLIGYLGIVQILFIMKN